MFASRDDLDLTEVGDAVWQLRLPIPWENGHVNCFLLPEGGEVDMIDCGMRSDESLALIWGAVERVAGPGARLRRLVVTHIHPDHYGGAGEITSRAGALFDITPGGNEGAQVPQDWCFNTCGARMNSELAAENIRRMRWVCCVPIHGIRTRLTPSAPTIAPRVFAA